MASERDLYPEDRARLWPLVDPIVAKFDNAGDANLRRMAAEAVSLLTRLIGEGEAWAERPLRICAIIGMRTLISKRLKMDRGTVRIAYTGAVIDVPARMGIEVANPTPPPAHIFQQPLWWEFTWEEFDQKVRRQQALRDRLSGIIAALLEVQKLREQYPESRTPGEACKLAGIDPRKFSTGTEG